MKYQGYGIVLYKKDVIITLREFECDDGPHTADKIIKICELKEIISPHKKRIYKFRPDEDFARITKSDYWCAITTSEVIPTVYEITWGEGNYIRAPFVICREQKGKLYPFSNNRIHLSVIEYMIKRSEWRRDRDDIVKNKELRIDLDNVDDLIDYLGRPKDN